MEAQNTAEVEYRDIIMYDEATYPGQQSFPLSDVVDELEGS